MKNTFFLKLKPDTPRSLMRAQTSSPVHGSWRGQCLGGKAEGQGVLSKFYHYPAGPRAEI